jgi:hypothetical protein
MARKGVIAENTDKIDSGCVGPPVYSVLDGPLRAIYLPPTQQ